MRYLRDTLKLYLCFGNDKLLLVNYTDTDISCLLGSLSLLIVGLYFDSLFCKNVLHCPQLRPSLLILLNIVRIYSRWRDFSMKLALSKKNNHQSIIHLIKNANFHLKNKHTDVRHQWVKNVLENKIFERTKFIVIGILQIWWPRLWQRKNMYIAKKEPALKKIPMPAKSDA